MTESSKIWPAAVREPPSLTPTACSGDDCSCLVPGEILQQKAEAQEEHNDKSSHSYDSVEQIRNGVVEFFKRCSMLTMKGTGVVRTI